MPFRTPRIAALALLVLGAVVAPTPSRAAGAVLPASTSPDPVVVRVRMAVALHPTGSTRWSEVTLPAATRALWLVPVRPGATIGWASTSWLDALDAATGPRLVAPRIGSTCPSKKGAEIPASWTGAGATQAETSFEVLASTSEASAWIARRGARVTSPLEGKIAALLQSGWQLAAVDLPSSNAPTSATLRVTDDAGPLLPLAITGGASDTRLTVYAIGPGMAGVPGARDVDHDALRWGPSGSNYAAWRNDTLKAGAGDDWIRESSSHGAIFVDTPVPDGAAVPSLVTSYFGATDCALRVSSQSESATALAPAALSCAGEGELGRALVGIAPKDAVVTRLAGWLPAGTLGANLPIELVAGAAPRSPVIRAGGYERCAGNGPPLTMPSGSGGEAPTYTGDGTVYVPSNGCGSGTVTTTTDTGYEDEGSSDGCSSSSSEGWDSSDDGSEGCSSSDSSESSSSSDSCSSSDSSSDDGWDSEDSDDGWDTSDEASFKSTKKASPKKPHASAPRPKKKSSPVSRFALLAVALLLPLRRRARSLLGDGT